MIRRYIFVAFLALVFTACSSNDKIDTSTAEGAFTLAEEYAKDERYEEAIIYYSEVKNKHPYSRFAILAELAIADIEFTRENYEIAEAAYRVFKELHPTNDKIDYVTYRLGLSIFHQLPPTIDRDLSNATSAILYFDEVVTSFPKSQYLAGAQEHRLKCEKMLHDKEIYIANWYFKKEQWLSALRRFEQYIKDFPNTKKEARAFYGATVSALKLKEYDKMKVLYQDFSKRYPDSKELAAAKKEIENAE